MFMGEEGMLHTNFHSEEFDSWFDLYELLVRTLTKVNSDELQGKKMSDFMTASEEETKDEFTRGDTGYATITNLA